LVTLGSGSGFERPSRSEYDASCGRSGKILLLRTGWVGGSSVSYRLPLSRQRKTETPFSLRGRDESLLDAERRDALPRRHTRRGWQDRFELFQSRSPCEAVGEFGCRNGWFYRGVDCALEKSESRQNRA